MDVREKGLITSEIKWLWIVSAMLLLFVSMSARGQVVSGGTFTEDERIVPKIGGKAAEGLPTERFVETDRQRNAPTGQALYVLNRYKKCYRGRFTIDDHGRKQLIIYENNPVPSAFCVYQPGFDINPTGFSISVADEGSCIATYSDGLEALEKAKYVSLFDIGKTVSLKYCLQNTVSYGEELAKRGLIEDISRRPAEVDADMLKKLLVKKFTVKMRVTKDIQSARAQVKSLKEAGLPAFFVRVNQGDEIYYRVCIGLFKTKKQASDFLAQIQHADVKAVLPQNPNGVPQRAISSKK